MAPGEADVGQTADKQMHNVTEGLRGVPLRGAAPQVMGWRRPPEAVDVH